MVNVHHSHYSRYNPGKLIGTLLLVALAAAAPAQQRPAEACGPAAETPGDGRIRQACEARKAEAEKAKADSDRQRRAAAQERQRREDAEQQKETAEQKLQSAELRAKRAEDALRSATTPARVAAVVAAGPVAAAALRTGQLLPADNCTICPPMVYIEPGVFQMGSPESERKPSLEAGLKEDQFGWSLPSRRVTISQGFGLGQTEVTLGQFKQFTTQANYQTEAEKLRGCILYENDKRLDFKAGTSYKNPGFTQTDNHPVVCVSWNDAQAYIRWLNQQTGNKYGYRLPSEAEWEYAARAGTTTAFSTGEQISTEQANFYGNGAYYGSSKNGEYLAKTSPVGSYPERKWGLSDMHGNVSEWVQDCWNQSYQGAPTNEKAWETKNCRVRVTRGGSWFGDTANSRSAHRNRSDATYAYNDIGLRLARSAP